MEKRQSKKVYATSVLEKTTPSEKLNTPPELSLKNEYLWNPLYQ